MVEDDPDARDALRVILEHEGYRVSVAGDGAEALEVFSREPPELVISDVSMPRTDGLALVSRLREAGPAERYVPVILISADDAIERRVTGLDLGADDYLTKPIQLNELLARVRVHLRQANRYSALQQRAVVDELTGVLNRRGIVGQLEREIARADRGGGPLSLLFFDLDDFKRVNDEFGHQAGDAILQQTAYALSAGVRLGDWVGRLGGDEFVVVAPDCPPEAAHALAARLRAALQTRASVGVAAHQFGESARDLLDRADAAMYANKRKQSGERSQTRTERV